jgi:hypothetical protein
MQNDAVRISCPNCSYSKDFPKDKAPTKSTNVTCPQCKHGFIFSPENVDSDLAFVGAALGINRNQYEIKKTEQMQIKGGTMQCPFCKETILEGAIKCRHCGSMLNAEPQMPQQQFQPQQNIQPQQIHQQQQNFQPQQNFQHQQQQQNFQQAQTQPGFSIMGLLFNASYYAGYGKAGKGALLALIGFMPLTLIGIGIYAGLKANQELPVGRQNFNWGPAIGVAILQSIILTTVMMLGVVKALIQSGM